MASGNPNNYFVHTLLRARDWQHRSQFDQVCDWWRGGGRGVCALVGMGGAGKTAIAERFLRVLPHVTESEHQLAKDNSLRTPDRLFVFSFYKDNEDRFFGELHAWLSGEPYDDSTRDPSFRQTLDLLKTTPYLLVLDGLEKVQDDGARGGVFGHITDGRLSGLVERLTSGVVPGVAAVITTRFPIAELEEQLPPHFLPINVEEISDDAGVSLLKTRGVGGVKDVLLRIVHDCGNHALTVDLAGGYIAEFGDGDPKTPLQLETTPKQESEINAEPAPQRRYVMWQEHRFARVAERYREGLAKRDPATLALLERVCLFRLGVDAPTLASIFTGKDRENISGERLARLSQQQLEQKLRLLTEMRLLESNKTSQPSIPSSQRSTRYSIHPAVRDGFLSGIGREAMEASREAVHQGLEVSLGEADVENPFDPATLDLLEEIVHHTLQSGRVPDALAIYQHRIGGFENFGWRLGSYERGERICRAFAGGKPPEYVAEIARIRDRDQNDRIVANSAMKNELPYFVLSEDQQASFINEWGLYLTQGA